MRQERSQLGGDIGNSYTIRFEVLLYSDLCLAVPHLEEKIQEGPGSQIGIKRTIQDDMHRRNKRRKLNYTFRGLKYIRAIRR